MGLNSLFSLMLKGGSGSGNFGHKGRPGVRGGSSSLGSGSSPSYRDERGILIHKISGGSNLSDSIMNDKVGLPFLYNSKTNTFHLSSYSDEEHAHFMKGAKEGNSGIEEGFIIRGRIDPKRKRLIAWDLSGEKTIEDIAGPERQSQRIMKNNIKSIQNKIEKNPLKYKGKNLPFHWITPEDMGFRWGEN